MTLFDGISSRLIETDRGSVSILERTADDPAAPAENTVVLLPDAATTSPLWQEFMQDLPSDLRIIALDLPLDQATDGAHDLVGALEAVLATLGLETAHFLGWGRGVDLLTQYAQDRPVLSLTSQATVEDASGTASLERPTVVRRALLETIGYIGHPASPAPPTETIILSSSD